MALNPNRQSARDRRETFLMIDALRKVEYELHHRLIETRTLPPEWQEIHARRAERHPKTTRVTANFDADVVRYFKSLGRGYQWRMNQVLRAYMHGRLAKIIEGPDTTDYILHPERVPAKETEWDWGDTEEEAAKLVFDLEEDKGLSWREMTIEERAKVSYQAWKKEAEEAKLKGLKPPPLLGKRR